MGTRSPTANVTADENARIHYGKALDGRVNDPHRVCSDQQFRLGSVPRDRRLPRMTRRREGGPRNHDLMSSASRQSLGPVPKPPLWVIAVTRRASSVRP
jgi:hypothetical protein